MAITISQKKEEELRAKRFGSRLDRKITFDFAGRQVIDADDHSAAMQVRCRSNGNHMLSHFASTLHPRYIHFIPQMYSEDPLAQPSEISQKNKELIAMLTEEHGRYLVNPSIKIPAPTFVDVGSGSEPTKK